MLHLPVWEVLGLPFVLELQQKQLLVFKKTRGKSNPGGQNNWKGGPDRTTTDMCVYDVS